VKLYRLPERKPAVFREAARILAREGFLAFTVQAHEGAGIVLGEDARYAHGEPYLRSALDAAGLDPVVLEAVSTRMDRGEPVPGYLVVAEPRRPRASTGAGPIRSSPGPTGRNR
jgi:predicted TPR repeat methyltransferase